MYSFNEYLSITCRHGDSDGREDDRTDTDSYGAGIVVDTVDKTFMSTLKFKSQQSTNFPGPLAERKTRVSAGRALSLPVPWLELLQRVLGKHFQHEDHCWGQSGTELGS